MGGVKDRLELIEKTQTDEKGSISELVALMRSENGKMQDEFKDMNKEMLEWMVAKTTKIDWFERKLNKWVKLFEDAEV